MQKLKSGFLGIAFILLTLPVFSQNSEIVINELMARNTTYAMDEEGQFDDYIELRNNSATEYNNLKNWTLTDTLGIPDKWTFPDDATIEPHGYMVLWADEDGGQGDLHVNFKLSGGGEELYLFDSGGVLIDQVVFGEQVDDMSYARVPNGTGDFVIKNGTIGFNNDNTSSISIDFEEQFSIYPNPTSDILYLENLNQVAAQVSIFDSIGNKVLSIDTGNNDRIIDLSRLRPGMYIISINGGLSDRLIKL